MANQPQPRWRPLTIGDVAFLMQTQPDYLKKWIKRGRRYGVPFCLARWVTTTDQRLWAFDDVERWALVHEFELRALVELEARAERRRRALGWETVEVTG
jgi:hypothetical protein